MSANPVYQNITNPLEVFRQLYTGHELIRLLNVYKGLPISNEAAITAWDASSISVSSIKSQIVCIYLARQTYIQSPALPAIVQANVLQFNPGKMEVRLGQFQYVHETIGERRQVRVVPVNSVNSLVQPKNGRGPLKAELADISNSGLAIYLTRQFFIPEIFKVSSELMIHLTLPVVQTDVARGVNTAPSSSDPMQRFSRENIRGTSGLVSSVRRADERKEKRSLTGDVNLVVRGEIKNIKLESRKNRVRIGLRLYPDVENQSAIASFISQRQSELVREVRALYEMLQKFEN